MPKNAKKVSTQAKKKKRGSACSVARASPIHQVTGTNDADVAVKSEVQQILALGLAEQLEKKYGTEEEDSSYFVWYDTLHSIGGDSITQSLLKMRIFRPEHISRDVYYEKQAEDEDTLRECMSLAVTLTSKVLDQLSKGIRKLDRDWPKLIKDSIYGAADLIAVRYAINLNMK